MTIDQFTKVAEALAWPLVALAAIIAFAPVLWRLLDALSSSLKLRNVKVKAMGVEVELTPEEAKSAVADLLQEIADSTSDLDDKEIALFDTIVDLSGTKTVREMAPEFARSAPQAENPVHKRLGRLRDRQLVRPLAGGAWREHSHPVPTGFGRLVHRIRSRQRVR